MSIRLKLNGFEEFLKEIEKAGGSINSATKNCIEKTAKIMDAELRLQMLETDPSPFGNQGALGQAMPPPEIETSGNRFTARVGFKKTAYDPQNPSDFYKAVFLNYGTPSRSKHGQVKARKFIQIAKKKANKLIKAEQEKTLKEILKGLQK